MSEQPMQQAIDEVWRLFKETDARLDQRSRETDARFKQTYDELRRLEGVFGIRWGRLLEALVAPAALGLFRERGIDIHSSHQRLKGQLNGRTMELDIVLENQYDSVIIEVKSLANVEDVNDLLDDLSQASIYFSRFENRHVYGAIAALEFAADADRYAYRQGLFVLGLTGDGLVQILNSKQFRPTDFGKGSAEL